jgi:signal transduction histidine kinase
MRTNRVKSNLAGYALAVLAVAAAMVLTRVLRGIGDSGLSPLFFGAVLLSAWYGGLGPGLVATVLASAGAAYLLLKGHPISFFALRDHFLRLIVFGVVSILTSSLQDAVKRAADASRRAKEAAEMANEAKSRFLAMVSHELRTPLSPVLMIADLLQRNETLPPQLREDVRCIRKNVDLEIRLIDDLVDLTRINSGKMHLREEIVEIHEPLKAAIAVCQEDLREKQLQLSVNSPSAQWKVEGDPVRLQQIFWNLIRNAIKFTPEGGRISLGVRAGKAGFVEVEISDNGIGIDPRRLSAIFEAFEQGGRDIQVQFGGLGLGLTICQALVQAHHGTITAASAGKGHGATFTVSLPVLASPAAEPAGAALQSAQLEVLPEVKSQSA